VRLSYIRFLLQHLSVDAWNPSTARDLAVPTALGKKNCDQEKAYQDRCSSPFFAIHHGAPALGPSPAWRAAANRRHPREFVSQLSSRTATPTKSLIIFSSLQSVGKPNCAGCALWSLFFRCPLRRLQCPLRQATSNAVPYRGFATFQTYRGMRKRILRCRLPNRGARVGTLLARSTILPDRRLTERRPVESRGFSLRITGTLL
jgi:hypothetical protein